MQYRLSGSMNKKSAKFVVKMLAEYFPDCEYSIKFIDDDWTIIQTGPPIKPVPGESRKRALKHTCGFVTGAMMMYEWLEANKLLK